LTADDVADLLDTRKLKETIEAFFEAFAGAMPEKNAPVRLWFSRHREPDWLTSGHLRIRNYDLPSDEFWSLTWRELDALATAWRKRERRQDVRNALLRYTMACLWAKDPPKLKTCFLPMRMLQH
jgi:hypothetical protein